LSTWTCLFIFIRTSFIIFFPLATKQKFVHHCKGCQ
jgi:hypothetical protein